MSEEFIASAAEMERRKRAFKRLASSLFAGAALSSLALFSSSICIAIPALIILGLFLALSGALFGRVFDTSRKTVIVLAGEMLEPRGPGRGDAYRLDAVTRVFVKRTVKGPIREMRIDIAGAGAVYINGLEKFEEFSGALERSLSGAVAVTTRRERIDYDHPLFYILFGALTGAVSAGALKLLMGLPERGAMYLQACLASLVVIAGIVMLCLRPVRGRYGGRARYADLCLGLLMLLAGLCLAFLSGILGN